jgi:hypothetical protein
LNNCKLYCFQIVNNCEITVDKNHWCGEFRGKKQFIFHKAFWKSSTHAPHSSLAGSG